MCSLEKLFQSLVPAQQSSCISSLGLSNVNLQLCSCVQFAQYQDYLISGEVFLAWLFSHT